MQWIRLVLIVAAACIATTAEVRSAEKDKLRNDLTSLRIRLLDMVEHLEKATDIPRAKKFILEFAVPAELAKVVEADEESFNRMAADFVEEKRKPMLDVLKVIVLNEPDEVQGGSIYIFKVPEAMKDRVPKGQISFMWVEKEESFFIKN